MRTARLSALIITSCLALPIGFAGCQTSQPGVKTSGMRQWTSIAANIEDATDAAEVALEDMNFENVNSQPGSVESIARGYMADGTEVKVTLTSAAPEVTDVSVHVGTFGDTSLGREIIARMQDELGIKRTAAAR